ncbi:four-carbon acid sugar kinase family protein [Williamsia phyllosphaerae]|uniref:Membrane protein n=1 Tax=Williamsia phyllosphaerae TaxID=885042 RepID=A0ABQ1UL26_9NOCA|nr:four-carbon acid sugar kinase family protein [Williamsia phyllosphaerae]GGF19461.1 membrane protein [Williamsia phyllosphaerae]
MTAGPKTGPAPVIIADDLTGAAETAAVFLGRLGGVELHLGDHTLRTSADGRLPTQVVDLGTRTSDEATAVGALAHAVSVIPAGTPIVKKIDSLLRGHVGAEIRCLVAAHPVIVAAGLPAARRVVQGGIVHVDGAPLHETHLWDAESIPAPTSIAALLTDIDHIVIGHGPHRAEQIVEACRRGAVAICDVATDIDLDDIVAASSTIPGVRLVGTAALAAAVARTMPDEVASAAPHPASLPVLAVVGTADAIRTAQVTALRAAGVPHVPVHVDHLLADRVDLDALASALDSGAAVVTIDGDLRPETTSGVAQALAATVAALDSRRRAHLVLTGGETARAVIDALGIESLRPIGEVERGAVVSITPDHRLIATKPGSFGDADTLRRVVDHLRSTADPTSKHPMSSLDSEVVP